MSVETITGVSTEANLQVSWPSNQDFIREGAQHLRNIKQILINLFENGAAVDSVKLGGQLPAYYLAYANLTGAPSIPTVNNPVITVTAGNGMTGGGTFSLNQAGAVELTLAHEDTTNQTTVTNAGSTYIQSIELDERGHIVSIASGDVGSYAQPMTLGAVGTYALMKAQSTTVDYTPGATLAGSELRYCTSKKEGAAYTPVPTGTWRCMGNGEREVTTGSYGSTIYVGSISVWLRIS